MYLHDYTLHYVFTNIWNFGRTKFEIFNLKKNVFYIIAKSSNVN